jgi:uroporphyrinogen-III synthase
VRIAVVGAGTARVFHEVSESDDQSFEVAFSPSKGILSCSFYDVLGACVFSRFLYSSIHLQLFISVNQFVPFLCSSALGKVLASELPRSNENSCKVLYPASAKAGHEIRESFWCYNKHLSHYCSFSAFTKTTCFSYSVFPKWCI